VAVLFPHLAFGGRLFVSKSQRTWTRCQDCGQSSRSQPLEVMVHLGKETQQYWEWRSWRLCPVCKTARWDALELSPRRDQSA
jgi:hypothetical protein